MDWAAALTYYGLLALFPAVIALVAIVGLFADPENATRSLTNVVDEIGPSVAGDTFSEPIHSITSHRGLSGVLAVLGFAVSIWAASGYVGAFSRASNEMYGTPEGRPTVKLRPLQLLITLVVVVLAAITLIALVVSGPVARGIGNELGLSDAAVTAYQVSKWPILIALVLTILCILYYATPNARIPDLRSVALGSIVALVGWSLASAGFALYVAYFEPFLHHIGASYDATYGTLGGVIVMLVWLWLINAAILFGTALNAERAAKLEPREPKRAS